MKIEIVEFYPSFISKNLNHVSGTLHVYLPDEGLDIRGCRVRVKKSKGDFYCAIPHGRQYDEQNKLQNYPMFSFFDDAKQQDLKKSLVEEAKKFMDVKIASLQPKRRQSYPKPPFNKNDPKTNVKGFPKHSKKPNPNDFKYVTPKKYVDLKK